MIRRRRSVIDDCRSSHRATSLCEIGDVCRDGFHAEWQVRWAMAGDGPDAKTTPDQLADQRAPDRSGTQHDVEIRL